MSSAAPLFTLATKRPPQPHKWGASRMVAADVSPSGLEQREWTCLACPLVRITILPKGRREWRFGNGCQFVDTETPECTGGETP